MPTLSGSRYDPKSTTGPEVLLCAPSTDIIALNPGGRYNTGTGTSNATALVAGVAALIRSAYPQLTAKQVIERLTQTAIDKGDPGRDPRYGYGIVDPVAALDKGFKARPWATPSDSARETAACHDRAHRFRSVPGPTLLAIR